MIELPARRVLEGEVFRPDVARSGMCGIEISVTGLPMVIEAEYSVVPDPELSSRSTVPVSLFRSRNP